MSKSKSKGAKDTKPSTVLSKVKAGAITKPAQSMKTKKQELAKHVAGREEKKTKKVKAPPKEPTPEPSSDSESDSESESESESEVETKTNGNTNGVKIAAATSDSEEDSDESESDSESEAPVTNDAKVDVPAHDSSDESESDADSSDESESEEEKPVKSAVMGELRKDESDSESAESDSDSDSDHSEVEVKAESTKRKAEEEVVPSVKKTKTELDTSKGANLFIGNLSWNVTEEWLSEEFETYGELTGCRVVTDKETGRAKGFGYVEFANAEDAARAHAEKQGAELDGRVMNVDFATPRANNNERQDNRRKSYGDSVSEPSDTLFIGNLSFEVGQDAISEAFGPHGTVLGVRLPTDRETGAPKGFGYVTFASVDEAKAAMENMQGHYLENRPVRLDYSQPRPQNGDSPGGRGGFGGRGRGRGGFGDRGRGGFGGRGGRGGRGDFRGGRGGARGGRGASTNRGGFGDFSGKKTTF